MDSPCKKIRLISEEEMKEAHQSKPDVPKATQSNCCDLVKVEPSISTIISKELCQKTEEIPEDTRCYIKDESDNNNNPEQLDSLLPVSQSVQVEVQEDHAKSIFKYERSYKPKRNDETVFSVVDREDNSNNEEVNEKEVTESSDVEEKDGSEAGLGILSDLAGALLNQNKPQTALETLRSFPPMVVSSFRGPTTQLEDLYEYSTRQSHSMRQPQLPHQYAHPNSQLFPAPAPCEVPLDMRSHMLPQLSYDAPLDPRYPSDSPYLAALAKQWARAYTVHDPSL